MTDGPFKNAGLASHWKKFGDSLVSDAVSRDERTERAERALMRDLPKSFRQLIHEVDQSIQKSHADVSARQAIDELFDKHQTTPFSDTLRRYFKVYISKPIPLHTAWILAIDSTIKRENGKIRIRMTEELMHARDRKQLSRADFDKASINLGCLDDIKVANIREDLRANKTAPKAALAKKRGNDDGPIG